MKNEIALLKNGQWKAFVFNADAAKLLNKRLKVYPTTEIEEGIFKFEASQLPYVRAVLTKYGGLALPAEMM